MLVSGSNAADIPGAEGEGTTGGWGCSTATPASSGWGSTGTANSGTGDEAAKAEGGWGSSTTASGWSSTIKETLPGKILFRLDLD